jgi:hypothetical protein
VLFAVEANESGHGHPGSTSLRTLSPPANSASQVNLPAIDRRALMQRAHLIARRFIGILPNYRACLAYGMRVAWADAKARQEHKLRFAGFVPRVLTAKQIADSRYATRRCGRSYTSF